MQQSHRYFSNDPQNPVSVETKNVITSKTRRNLMAMMVVKVAFTTMAHDISDYFINENSRMRKELVAMKQQVQHIVVDNQRLLS